MDNDIIIAKNKHMDIKTRNVLSVNSFAKQLMLLSSFPVE